MQNALARLITGIRKYEHINPALATLHWLPVKYRIDFKILLRTYKACNGLAPSYLSELLVPYVPSRNLRSANKFRLVEPGSRLVSRGDRAFAVRAPKLWNALPLGLKQASSVDIFKAQLKTHLYRKAFST